MAALIPSIGSCVSRMWPGERRFASRLEDKLEDDYLCWYDVSIGSRTHHPDFVVFHPSRGLLVLEAKDWHLATIISIDKQHATIVTADGTKCVSDPLEQARQYMYTITSKLERDALLVWPSGSLKGRPFFPYGHGVVLANISRKQFDGTDMAEVLPPHLVICQDEMTKSIDPESFQKRLWEMFPIKFKMKLSLPQIDRIRWHMFPEVRIPAQPDAADEAGQRAVEIPDILRVMDLQQEQLARSHAWCVRQLDAYHADKPVKERDSNAFFEACVESVIRSVDRNVIPSGQYDAVLIDEGHDFKPAWFKLVVQMIHPESNSLLVLYDDAQSIFSGQKKTRFSFSSVGIQAKGRTTILKLNYRNTKEILAVARAFADDLLSPADAEEDQAPTVLPMSAGGHGPQPLLVALPSLRHEAAFLARRLIEAHKLGVPWNDMAVIYRRLGIGLKMADVLKRMGIPYQLPQTERHAYSPTHDSVKVITMHSSKGLEFPLVCIPGIGTPGKDDEDPADEAHLLYVAMTRATNELAMTHSGASPLADKMTTAMGVLQAL